MKTCLALALVIVSAPISRSSEIRVLERGPNHRVWSMSQAQTNAPGGLEFSGSGRYTELRAGMHYWQNGAWVESRPDFLMREDGYAVALEAPHKVTIAPNANGPDHLAEVVAPDGRRLRSSVVGLVLFSPVTGQSVQVAAVRGSAGKQTAPNEIIFPDAFDGLNASLRFRNEVDRFHQEILLEKSITDEQLARLGFAPGSRPRLEIWIRI